MTNWIRNLTAGLIALAGWSLVGGAAFAQYPDKPVRLIVTWPAGGSADAVGRQLASALGAGLRQTVYVDNAAGASGNIGNGNFVRSPADGYTLLLATSTTNSAGPNLFTKLPFHPTDDFAPIALAAVAPSVLVVRTDSPFKTYKDIVEAAKAKPSKLSYGSGGSGNSAHLSAALFAKEMGVEVLHVPYKGNAPATTDLLGGQIDFMFDNNAVAMIKGGKLRGLATTGEQRTPVLPDIPTFKELGQPGVLLSTWYGIAAPKGTPPAVIDKVHAALIDGLKKTDAGRRLEDLGFQVKTMGPAEFAGFWKKEIDHYRELVRISGAKVE
jgi:tripartite-type tricarboxylate transporter receptor subunit TctC